MKLTEAQIEEIAGELECGLSCFYNLKTGEVKILPNLDSLVGEDEEFWEDDLKELDEHSADFFEFRGFKSYESYQLMVDFAEKINDTGLQNKLMTTLNKPKPFRNFKRQIDNSGEYRQQWFDFKKNCYIQWVKDQIDVGE